jgi:hypothetical protein
MYDPLLSDIFVYTTSSLVRGLTVHRLDSLRAEVRNLQSQVQTHRQAQGESSNEISTGVSFVETQTVNRPQWSPSYQELLTPTNVDRGVRQRSQHRSVSASAEDHMAISPEPRRPSTRRTSICIDAPVSAVHAMTPACPPTNARDIIAELFPDESQARCLMTL